MAHAARPAHPAGTPLVAVFSVGLAVIPLPVHAGAAAAPAAVAPVYASETGAAPGVGEPDEVRDEGVREGDGEAATEGTGEDATAGDEPRGEAAGDDAAGGEAAGDDAAGGEAAGDDATTGTAKKTDPKKPDPGTAAPGALGPTAAPLRPMQTAAWWTMFGAFAVGTAAGVLAGLAERQEDRATRMSTLFDAETGAQPLYVDRKDEYERYLRRGEGFATAAMGVGIIAGAATIAAITLFAIDARRQRGDAPRKQRGRMTLRVRGGGMQVRF
jgi:hypothetical protein